MKNQKGKSEIESEIEGIWQACLAEVVGKAIESGLADEQNLMAQNVVFRLSSLLQARVVPAFAQPKKNWIQIESLSKLRAVVGGRLELLKKRWVAAGFPLRLHRADHTADWKLDEEGWNALTLWLSSQKYSVRLLEAESSGFFEVCSEDSAAL